jgi:DNA integrity scanning protein DisA with diadenylate cyclase activity
MYCQNGSKHLIKRGGKMTTPTRQQMSEMTTREMKSEEASKFFGYSHENKEFDVYLTAIGKKTLLHISKILKMVSYLSSALVQLTKNIMARLLIMER